MEAVNGVERLAAGPLRFGARLSAARGSVIDYTGSAIVNAANEGCLSGGGVDGAVSNAGGDELMEARRALPCLQKGGSRGFIRCRTGDSRTTSAGEMACEWVIHAVGPNYRFHDDFAPADALLYSAYCSAMREAREKRLPDVAFSLLSAGIFRGDRDLRDVLALGILAVKAGAYEGLNDVFLVGFTDREVCTLTQLVQDLVVDADCERATEEMLDSFGATVQGLHQRAMLSAELQTMPLGYGMAAAAATSIPP